MNYESRKLEYKRIFVEDIKKTIIAFANTDGGEIKIGIADDGTITGVSDPDETILRVQNAIRDNIEPDVTQFTECCAETTDNKTIVVVRVERGTDRPYYLSSKGLRPEGVFVRQGPSTVPASKSAIREMIKISSGYSFEESRSLNQSLTFESTAQAFKEKGLDFGSAQQRTLGLISADGTYTNSALLLSDQCPHSIKAAYFQGTDKMIFRDRREFSGSLLKQLEESLRYLDLFNKTRSTFPGIYRVDQRDYHPLILREAVLNALIHRDYSRFSSTLISIFDDRMEIVNYGGLVEGMTYADLLNRISLPRNRRLANIFFRLGLIEEYGTGIARIFDAYKNFPQQPKISVAPVSFLLTLPNMNEFEKDQGHEMKNYANNERDREIMRFSAERKSITRKDVQERLNISESTAGSDLKRLTDLGELVRIGSGKNVRYVPVSLAVRP